MTHYPKLTGSLCYLSPASESDAVQWAQWLNDLAVALPLGREAYAPVTAEGQFQSLSDWSQRGDPVFTIVDRETSQPIGRCLLFNVNPVDRNATAGIFIGDKAYWNRGYGADALRLLLDYAFNLLNLNNVMLGVFEFNQRAIACYRKVGFKEIGRRRQARIIGGRKYDSILMDILAEEFESGFISRYIGDDR
jgi:RimJ/RimL family protein N-acetyltransferase